MFLGSIKSASRKKLESACEELSADVKKHEQELVLKEKQIERLSKNIRKWTRKYNQLELSISDTVIESFDSDSKDKAEEEKKHLQLMLVKLNRKNAKLEQRLEKMAMLLEKTSAPANEASVASNTAAVPKADLADEDFEPEFSPEFKKVLDHYAETTTVEV